MMVVRLNRTFKKDTTMTTIQNIANELSKKCDLKIIRPTFYKNTPNENILDQIPVSIYDFKHAFEILDKVKPDFILNMSGYEVIGLSFTIAANIKKIPVIKVFDLNPDFMKDWNTFEAFKAKTSTAFSKTALEDVTGEKNNLISNFKFLFRKFKFLFNTIKFSNISNFYFFSLILLIFFSLVTKNDIKIQKQFQADLNLCSTQAWVDTLISNGFRKSGLVLTGSCTYDELYSKTHELVFTKEKIKILQEADFIFIKQLKERKLYDKIWQAFAVLLPVKTIGVMGDQRSYEYTCVLRAVTSVDGMTAEPYYFDPDDLAQISTKIINEVKGVNRVVYDNTSKPPGTIEWE